MSDVQQFPPVTDADVLAAWTAFYDDGVSATVAPPGDNWWDKAIMVGIRRSIEADRKRVAESNFYSENRHS